MKVSVMMLAFNADLFLQPSLQSIYPIADEIFVVEGAVPQAAFSATKNGHSTDRTLYTLAEFPDPMHKIRVITNKGFWPNKDVMCNQAAECASGDLLWQVDADEVYLEEDVEKVTRFFDDHMEVTVGTFPVYHFWHNFHTVTCGGHWMSPFTRVYRSERGSSWQSHEPPVLLNAQGIPWSSLGEIHHFEDIHIFHYSYVTPEQALWKSRFFLGYVSNPVTSDEAQEVGMTSDWFTKVWQAWSANPTGVEALYGTTPGGGGATTPYQGPHPSVMHTHPLWEELSR